MASKLLDEVTQKPLSEEEISATEGEMSPLAKYVYDSRVSVINVVTSQLGRKLTADECCVLGAALGVACALIMEYEERNG